MASVIDRATITTGIVDPGFPPLNYLFTDNLVNDLGANLTTTLSAWLQTYVPQKFAPLTAAQRASEKQRIRQRLALEQSRISALQAELKAATAPLNKRRLKRKLATANRQVGTQNTSIAKLKTRTKIVNDHVTKIAITPTNGTNGARYYLSTSTGAKVFQPDVIAIAVKECINDLLQLDYYNLQYSVNNALTPILGYYANTPNNFLSKPIFQNLSRLDIFDCEFIAMTQGLMANNMNLLAGDKSSWENWRTVGHSSDNQGTFIWVPFAFPLILFDGTEGSTIYAWNTLRGRYERTNAGQKRLGCYRVTAAGTAAAPDGIQSFTPQIAGTRGSSGGGGAMRADRVTEVDYRWTGPSKLGTAIGMRAAQMVAPTDALYMQSPIIGARAAVKTAVSGTMASGIVYWRKFIDPVPTPPSKKNLPLTTLPLTPVSYSKTDDLMCYRVSAFTKKKKGSWQLSIFGIAKPAGEALKHGNDNERVDAGTVMEEAFIKMGLDLNGSATQFAIDRIAPARDAVASAQWAILSNPLVARNGQAAGLAAAKLTIRTSQEWCHLYGHGDGGNESVENFLSGSKHCNTEQLAIELAQRYGSQPGLSAKITGYIFPNTPTWKLTLLQSDRAFLFLLNPDLFKPMADDNDLIAAGKTFFGQDPAQFDTMLPTLGGTPEVPTLAVYSALDQAAQAKVHTRLQERLHDSIAVAWPLASVIRYKIYFANTKIFDHFFWAQKESFDLNEFNILYWTIRRVIADATGSRASFDIEVDLKALRNAALLQA